MQRRIPTVFMRGGTSRALVFRDEDLPSDPAVRDQIILAAFGSPDPYLRQINGIGGAISSTSKVVIISHCDKPGIPVNYEFGQVSIDRPVVDRRGACGNMAAAVGPYAIDQGMVIGKDPVTEVRFFSTNTTGNPRDILDVPGLGQIEVSIVDTANLLVLFRFEALGLSGNETLEEIETNARVMQQIEEIRVAAGLAAGLTSDSEEMRQTMLVAPLPAMVTSPLPYQLTNGDISDPAGLDLVAKAVSMRRPHRAYPMTGAICTTIAAGIPGTIVRDAVSSRARETGMARLGHASGTIEMVANPYLKDGTWWVDKVSTARTARRLMEGCVLVPDRCFSALE